MTSQSSAKQNLQYSQPDRLTGGEWSCSPRPERSKLWVGCTVPGACLYGAVLRRFKWECWMRNHQLSMRHNLLGPRLVELIWPDEQSWTEIWMVWLWPRPSLKSTHLEGKTRPEKYTCKDRIWMRIEFLSFLFFLGRQWTRGSNFW